MLVVALAGIAAALWTANGNGSGRATALSATTITVAASSGAADLYPGFTQGDLHFTATNPNPYAVAFTDFTAGTITSSDPAGCPETNVTVDNRGGINVPVAENASDVAGSIPDVVTLAIDAPDACQGVAFDVVLTLTGSQS